MTGDEIFSGTALTSSAYWMAYGSCSVNSVTGGVATLKFTGSISGSDYIAFNKGYLGSKLEQGHKYRLTMEAKASVNSAVLVGFIGYYKSTGDADLINEDAVFWGDSLTTSYKTFTAEFTATRRDSNTSDAFIIAVVTNCTVNIRSISLKEA